MLCILVLVCIRVPLRAPYSTSHRQLSELLIGPTMVLSFQSKQGCRDDVTLSQGG